MTQTQKPPATLTTSFENSVIRIEPTPKWIRAVFAGETVLDTKRAVILFEKGSVPAYYIPLEDVRSDLLTPTDHSTHCPRKGDACYYTLRVGDRVAENAAWYYPQPFASSPDLADDDSPDLRGYVAFYWSKMDHWFEEDEEVFVHARDPYKRVDVSPSSRHVQVVIDGVTVADTQRPTLLFETGMPTRYYVPLADVRLDLLTASDRTTGCPYKGQAGYYSVPTYGEQGQDIAWYYRYPTRESAGVANHVCFFNERVDLIVNGETLERPATKWSPR